MFKISKSEIRVPLQRKARPCIAAIGLNDFHCSSDAFHAQHLLHPGARPSGGPLRALPTQRPQLQRISQRICYSDSRLHSVAGGIRHTRSCNGVESSPQISTPRSAARFDCLFGVTEEVISCFPYKTRAPSSPS
jgi:hypothetical protein